MGEQNQLAVQPYVADDKPFVIQPYSGLSEFEAAQRMARSIASSAMVPEAYRGENKIGDVCIALDYAARLRVAPLMVLQNLHVIEGRPALGSSFIIACINGSRRFTPLRFRTKDLGTKTVKSEVWTGPAGQRTKQVVSVEIHDWSCVAVANDIRSGEEVVGPPVTIELAVHEGWYHRRGSKWKTMPQVMLQYRAAAFFGRLYAADILMGMQSVDELEDIKSGAIEVETVEPPPLPRRETRAPRGPEVVVESDPTPAAPVQPAPAPRRPLRRANAPATAKPASEDPKPEPQVDQEPPAKEEKALPARVRAWVAENKITAAEILDALAEYLGESVAIAHPDDPVADLSDTQIAFFAANGPAIAKAIEGNRV